MPGSFFNTLMVSFNISISSCISYICARSCSISVSGGWSGVPAFRVSGCMFLSLAKAAAPPRRYFFRQAYMLARPYPISPDTDFILSPSSKQRCNAPIFTSIGGFRGCSAVFVLSSAFRGAFGIPSLPIHVYRARLVG